MLGGSWGSRLTSRATLGVSTEGTTWLKTTSSTSRPSTSLRKSSSRAACRARATALTSRKTVPLLAKEVRIPATTATRRPPLVSAMVPPLTSHLLPLTLFSDNARHCPPMFGIRRLHDLTAVDDRKWGNQAGELTRAQQVRTRIRAPARLALRLEECFHDEQAAGRDQLEDPRHLGPVKIIEYQNRIKNAELRPFTLEVQLHPLPRQTRRRSSPPG